MNKFIIRICLPAVVAVAISLSAQPQASHAGEVFRKLQSLSGDWQGKDEQGNEVNSSFQAHDFKYGCNGDPQCFRNGGDAHAL
jgi:hypothetical protein